MCQTQQSKPNLTGKMLIKECSDKKKKPRQVPQDRSLLSLQLEEMRNVDNKEASKLLFFSRGRTMLIGTNKKSLLKKTCHSSDSPAKVRSSLPIGCQASREPAHVVICHRAHCSAQALRPVNEITVTSTSSFEYLNVTIICEYKILRFCDSDDFAGINFCDFAKSS